MLVNKSLNTFIWETHRLKTPLSKIDANLAGKITTPEFDEVIMKIEPQIMQKMQNMDKLTLFKFLYFIAAFPRQQFKQLGSKFDNIFAFYDIKNLFKLNENEGKELFEIKQFRTEIKKAFRKDPNIQAHLKGLREFLTEDKNAIKVKKELDEIIKASNFINKRELIKIRKELRSTFKESSGFVEELSKKSLSEHLEGLINYLIKDKKKTTFNGLSLN